MQRHALELELARLREKKSELPEDEYYAQLEPLLLKLAELYRDIVDPALPQLPADPASCCYGHLFPTPAGSSQW